MAEGGETRREGRGRLSSIDLLPEEAEPDVVWALEQLRERSMPQNAILDEFNKRLADRGIGKVSKSAWSRYSVRKAIRYRKLDEVQRISGELVKSLGTVGPDQVTVAVAEMIKGSVFELLEEEKQTSKGLMEMSRALSTAVAAQKGSAEYRRQLEQEARARAEAAFEKAEEMVREAGLSAERIAQLRREFLGVGK